MRDGEWLGQYRALVAAPLTPPAARRFAPLVPAASAPVSRWSLYVSIIRVPQDPSTVPALFPVCTDLTLSETQVREKAERLLTAITSLIAAPSPSGCSASQVQQLRSQWLALPIGSYAAVHVFRSGQGSAAFSFQKTKVSFGGLGSPVDAEPPHPYRHLFTTGVG